MVAPLWPTFELPPPPQSAAPVVYRRAPLYDFLARDVVRDGRGRIVWAEPYRAWVQWQLKCLLTERLAYLIYSANYGCEIEAVLRVADPAMARLRIQRAITDALLADPRTGSVGEFVFAQQGDRLDVSLTVRPTVGPAVGERISVSLVAPYGVRGAPAGQGASWGVRGVSDETLDVEQMLQYVLR